MKEVLKSIEDGAECLGTGEWEKDSAFQIYRVNDKFYSIIVYDHQNLYLMDDTLQEINEDEINKYI